MVTSFLALNWSSLCTVSSPQNRRYFVCFSDEQREARRRSRVQDTLVWDPRCNNVFTYLEWLQAMNFHQVLELGLLASFQRRPAKFAPNCPPQCCLALLGCHPGWKTIDKRIDRKNMNLDQFRYNIKASVRRRWKDFPLKIWKEKKDFRAMMIPSSNRVDYNPLDNND